VHLLSSTVLDRPRPSSTVLDRHQVVVVGAAVVALGALGGAATHVLCFWPEPAPATVRGCLGLGGWVALGYRLRRQVPRRAQSRFPLEAHTRFTRSPASSRPSTITGEVSVQVYIWQQRLVRSDSSSQNVPASVA
jgi:hypothetical protein